MAGKSRARGLGLVATSVALTIASVILPAGSAHASVVFNGNGFDTCSAPSIAQMSAWTASPYRSVGIYIGGANQACPDGNLSAAWVTAIESQGWKLAPLYVGLQAPCATQTGLTSIDETPTTAATTEGTAAADDAVAQATLLGIAPSNPLYFDMESYNNTASNNDPACVPAVLSFVAAWSTELHRLGYLAGLYGSAASAISDQVAALGTTPASGLVDDIWFADWNNQATVFGDPYFPDGYWNQQQRIHQFEGNQTATYGGVTLNVDFDYDDAALACVGGGASGDLVPATRNGPVVWSGATKVASGAGPGAVAGQVSVVSAGPTRVDAFWRGVDGNLWTASYANGCGWSAAASLGAGPLGSDPQAVSSLSGRIDVFWRGGDGSLWHVWNNGSGWAPSPQTLGGGGTLASAPVPVSPGPTAITVLWRSTSGNVGADSYSDATGWQGTVGLGGGPLGSDLHAVVSGPGRVEAFWEGRDKNVWELSTTGSGWTGPTLLGAGPLGGEPDPTSAGTGRIDVFWRGQDGGIWHVWTSDNVHWSGPATQGGAGTVAGQVVASSTAVGRVAVVYRGGDGNLWSAHYADGVGWTVPASAGGGPLGSDPSAVSPAPGYLDVYWAGTDAGLWHMSAPGLELGPAPRPALMATAFWRHGRVATRALRTEPAQLQGAGGRKVDREAVVTGGDGQVGDPVGGKQHGPSRPDLTAARRQIDPYGAAGGRLQLHGRTGRGRPQDHKGSRHGRLGDDATALAHRRGAGQRRGWEASGEQRSAGQGDLELGGRRQEVRWAQGERRELALPSQRDQGLDRDIGVVQRLGKGADERCPRRDQVGRRQDLALKGDVPDEAVIGGLAKEAHVGDDDEGDQADHRPAGAGVGGVLARAGVRSGVGAGVGGRAGVGAGGGVGADQLRQGEADHGQQQREGQVDVTGGIGLADTERCPTQCDDHEHQHHTERQGHHSGGPRRIATGPRRIAATGPKDEPTGQDHHEHRARPWDTRGHSEGVGQSGPNEGRYLQQ